MICPHTVEKFHEGLMAVPWSSVSRRFENGSCHWSKGVASMVSGALWCPCPGNQGLIIRHGSCHAN